MTQIPHDCNYLCSMAWLLDKFLLKCHYSNFCKAASDTVYPSRKLWTAATLLQPCQVGAAMPAAIWKLFPKHSTPTMIKYRGGRHKDASSHQGCCKDGFACSSWDTAFLFLRYRNVADTIPPSHHNFIHIFLLSRRVFLPETWLSAWHQMDMKSSHSHFMETKRRKSATTTLTSPSKLELVQAIRDLGRSRKSCREKVSAPCCGCRTREGHGRTTLSS